MLVEFKENLVLVNINKKFKPRGNMKNNIKTILLCSTLFSLSGCEQLEQVVRPAENVATISAPSLTISVPNDTGIVQNGNGLVRDIQLDSFYSTLMPGAYQRTRIQDKTLSSFVVHVRTDNGTSGSGIKYTVNYTVNENAKGYSVLFQPVQVATYQQGLIGKFPVPNFTPENLSTYLKSFSIHYKIEINSKYNSDSVYANFERLAKKQAFDTGETDPVTGKIYKNWFITNYKGKPVRYVVQTYPYQNGSKSVIYVALPASETSPGNVDFQTVIKEVKSQLSDIANS